MLLPFPPLEPAILLELVVLLVLVLALLQPILFVLLVPLGLLAVNNSVDATANAIVY